MAISRLYDAYRRFLGVVGIGEGKPPGRFPGGKSSSKLASSRVRVLRSVGELWSVEVHPRARGGEGLGYRNFQTLNALVPSRAGERVSIVLW